MAGVENPAAAEEEVCSFCLEVPKEADLTEAKPCRHRFCAPCICRHLRLEQQGCPNCRVAIKALESVRPAAESALVVVKIKQLSLNLNALRTPRDELSPRLLGERLKELFRLSSVKLFSLSAPGNRRTPLDSSSDMVFDPMQKLNIYAIGQASGDAPKGVGLARDSDEEEYEDEMERQERLRSRPGFFKRAWRSLFGRNR